MMTGRQVEMFADARVVRDLGQQRKGGSAFLAVALAELKKTRPQINDKVTGEILRIHLERIGVKPPHSNAWGSVVLALLKSGHLIDTGVRVPMQDPKSHRRKESVYRWSNIAP